MASTKLTNWIREQVVHSLLVHRFSKAADKLVADRAAFAAKVYRERARRDFRDDAIYRQGRAVLDRRYARAIANRTRKGKVAQGVLWIDHEFQTLRTLHQAGADVPRPIARAEHAILMSYAGEIGEPAPPLHRVRLDPPEAVATVERVLRNVGIPHLAAHAAEHPAPRERPQPIRVPGEERLHGGCVAGAQAAHQLLVGDGRVVHVQTPTVSAQHRKVRGTVQRGHRDPRGIRTARGAGNVRPWRRPGSIPGVSPPEPPMTRRLAPHPASIRRV